MSVSEALAGNLTGLVERSEMLKLRLECGELEQQEIGDVIHQLVICVKQLQIEVSKLDRRIEDVFSQLTR